MGDRPVLSLVVPCFNEAAGLASFWARTSDALDALGVPAEAVFVDDGSRDATFAILSALAVRDPRVRVVALSRNFGKEIALAAGLDHARGDAVVPIDADLQHPPELIAELVARWREGNDVVIALRRDRATDGLTRRVASDLFHRLFSSVSTTPVPRGAGDFRLLSRPVVDALRAMPERTRYMKGMYAWVGFRTATVDYDVEDRAEGRSRYGLLRLWRLALDGIVSFSALPLRVSSFLGALFALVAIGYGAWLVVRTLVHGADVPGYASLMVVVLFLGGVQLLSLGVIGEYLGRIYDEVKARPLYVVRARLGFPDRPAGG
ncbi:MAG: glycosyltransferase family 2 protein [Vicinamibacteria bacterium]|jgi:glycosyltransferase involved in cell wall biosynthesis